MTPVAPVRSKVSLHVKRARAPSAWASVRCDYADRGSGYTGPYVGRLGGETLYGCSLTAVLRTRENKRKYGTAELRSWGPPVPRPPSRTRCGAHAHDEGGG